MSVRGHSMTVATTWQPKTEPFEIDGSVAVHRLRDLTSRVPGISADPFRHNPPPFPDPEAVLRLRRLVKRLEPDLVHSYGWLTHSVAAALLGSKVPLLVSTQDYGNICALRTLYRNGEKSARVPHRRSASQCAGANYGTAKGAVAVGGIFGSRPLLRRRVTRVHSISRYVAGMIEQDLKPRAPIEIVPELRRGPLGGADRRVDPRPAPRAAIHLLRRRPAPGQGHRRALPSLSSDSTRHRPWCWRGRLPPTPRRASPQA